MKHIYIHTILLFIAALLASDIQAQKSHELGEVVVTARRKLNNIGIVKTTLDSTLLRDNIANSLADVISQNTSIYIKSYGRGSLATISFRGTAPSHTKVTWNGLNLNSPMLGMVDLSLIPSYFIDDASIYHGASSTGVTGGGLGGAVTLDTKPVISNQKVGANFVQGISSYNTFDEFLKVHANINTRLQSVTRVYFADSDNDFKYTNYDKVVDESKGETRSDRNKNGDYRDFHVLQELYYNAKGNNQFNFAAWYFNSSRGLPMLKTDQREENNSRNEQDENTLRTTIGWTNTSDKLKLAANIGYTYSDIEYWLKGAITNNDLVTMIDSESKIHTGHSSFSADWFASSKLMFTAKLSANWHKIDSHEKKTGQIAIDAKNKNRLESSAFISAKYNITSRLGISSSLRAESYGSNFTPIIPSAYIDYLLIRSWNVLLKGSVTRNYRYPTLNDLYFQPGGNPDLKVEKGFTYDLGGEFAVTKDRYSFGAEASFFNSRINDWILWEATPQGYWRPKNVKLVRSYGVELKAHASSLIGNDWKIGADASWALTHSINKKEMDSENDLAVGKQLPYIPVRSASASARLAWQGFQFTYKLNHYSERFTTTSNDPDVRLRVAPYYMSDISLEKMLLFKFANISLKVNINNLFDEEYVSVLSRPMAGRNYGVFVGITPKW